MKLPKMILFDYGQTLISESKFNGVAGTGAVLRYATRNPNNISAEQIQAFANELNNDIGRYKPDVRNAINIEIHNHIFQNYLYEYFDIEIGLTHFELEKVFWDNASPGVITNNIQLLLSYLKERGIRSGVISNISYSGEALENRIYSMLPENEFEFILATSEYVFRKPHNRIFELGLRKAKLKPEDVWYCGDSTYFDIEGASNSGIQPVWYTGALESDNKIEPVKGTIIIKEWLELIEILKEIKET
jgi:putative hydrolase of the HAD superfamily